MANDNRDIRNNFGIVPIAGATVGGDLKYLLTDAAGKLETTAVISGDVNVDSTSVDTNGIIGKPSGGDFTTAYASAITITCAALPTYHPTLINADIITVVQISNTGVVLNTYSRDDMPMTVAGNVITVTGASFNATDSFVVYTNVERVDTSILTTLQAQLSNGLATHTSPNDFTATYTSNITITLAGYPVSLISSEQIVYILQLKADNTYKKFVNGENCAIGFVAGVLTIYGAGTPFVVADKYRVGIRLQDKGYDASLDVVKTVEQSPERDWYTDPVNLVTEQNLTATNDVIGATIDVRGYKNLILFIAADANSSLDVVLTAFTKTTSAGSEYTPSNSNYTSNIILWSGAGVDFLKSYRLDVEGYAFIQLRVIAGTVGATAGDLTIDIAKEY